MDARGTSSLRLSNKTAHGTSLTAPRCLVRTDRVNRVKTAWRISEKGSPWSWMKV